jgi:hypothetical protein
MIERRFGLLAAHIVVFTVVLLVVYAIGWIVTQLFARAW